MKIGVLGAGSWGFCLANLLVNNGHDVICWTTKQTLVDQVNDTGEHPRFPGYRVPASLKMTTSLHEAISDKDLIIESVTASGLRPVLEKVNELNVLNCPIVITSKGIELISGLIMPEVIESVLGEHFKKNIGFLSGPSYADEVIKGMPTSVVASGYSQETIALITEAFTSPVFRVYPNSDMRGVAYGGALKNVIAIACGITAGLNFGHSAMASVITRGLHEIRKFGLANGCKAETMYGLAGMGDLFLTCSSRLSRNFRFGELLAQGYKTEDALKAIGTVVEGAYTCEAALKLSEEQKIPMPITEMVYLIVYEKLSPQEAVNLLMQRAIKEEHL